jgi:outer membrane lipoprotein LolB
MFTLNRILCFVLLLTTVMLSGCANRLMVKTAVRSDQYDAPFSFNGRVSVKRGVDFSSASLRWVHNPEADEDEILILEPLGQTIARIHREAQGSMLEADGRFYVSQDVESLTKQVLGWTFPLSLLSHWIVGVPSKGSEADIRRDAKKQITVLKQAGWEIRYQRYANVTPEALPTRFVMKNDKLEMTIIIDEWEKQQP